MDMSDSKKKEQDRMPAERWRSGKVKFEIYGEEMIDKKVMRSGASGRVYLPPNWVNRHVKVIRLD